MPEEVKLDFQKIMEIGAESFGGALASGIIERMFGGQNNTEKLITEAIEEICARLTIIIDNAFMKQSIADTNSLASRLLAYLESNDINSLDEIFANASDTVHRLRLFDTIESITACNYVSTIHLVATKALAEHNPGYNETLKRLGKSYAEWSESTVHRFDSKKTVKEPIYCSTSFSSNIYHGYYIKESSQSTVDNQLVFYTHYQDEWGNTPQDIWRRVEAEPINVAKSLCIKELQSPFPDLFQIRLTKEGINDKTIESERVKFNEKALQTQKDFLGKRVDVSNATMESILYACNAWKA